MIPKKINHQEGHTVVSDDLFMPAGFYTDQDSIDIAFDSRCITTVTPFKKEYLETLQQ